MKNIFYILLILLTFGITSCNSDDGPAAIPKKELQNALDLLAQGKMEQYMSKLDFGEELKKRYSRRVNLRNYILIFLAVVGSDSSRRFSF